MKKILPIIFILLGTLTYGSIQTEQHKPEIISPMGEAVQAKEVEREDDDRRGEKHLHRDGWVSWYGKESCVSPDCLTASGKVFTGDVGTCACSYDFELGDRFVVTYGGKSVLVVCNDRGGFDVLGRTLDLSQGSFEVLAPLSKGVILVKIEKL